MAFTPEQKAEMLALMDSIDRLLDDCHAQTGEILATIDRIEATCQAIIDDMDARRREYTARFGAR